MPQISFWIVDYARLLAVSEYIPSCAQIIELTITPGGGGGGGGEGMS